MINLRILIGFVLSIAIHVAALYGKGIYTPPKVSMEQGRTVVQLTLMPSVASPTAAPEPQNEAPTEPQEEAAEPLIGTRVEPQQVEQAPLPAHQAEPAIKPEPELEAVAETAAADSAEQNASLIAEKGVTAEAEPAQAVHPTYPRVSQRHGEEGTVSLSIQVHSNGQAGEVSVLQSSGYRRLDDAAIKAVRATTFTPARHLERNIDSTIELSFTFQLTDD